MASPFQQLAQQQYSQNPKSEAKNPYRSPFEQIAQENKYQEGFLKSSFRTASQIPQGLLEATTPGLAASLWQLLSMGEVLDPEEVEHIKTISEREGIPFDENAYYEAAQEALGTIPTVANIAREIEERTGAPLEAKTPFQKGIRLASLVGKLQPGTQIQKGIAGATGGITSELLKKGGVPEPFAELAGLGAGGIAGAKTPAIDIGKATKPSGLPARQFEKLTEPREVSAKKLSQINEKLESDFRDISDKIIAESPIGETAESLAQDPLFKQQSRELLNQAQEIADSMTGNIPSSVLKKELADMTARRVKGFALSEYEKNYMKFMKEFIEDIIPERIRPGEKVEQYRKNNASAAEYYEPGASKALNRAKRDALLDYNRAITNVMEKAYPESELVPVFKEGNARWTKIMDAEAVDKFVGKIFEDKINFKKMHDFFDKQGYGRIFKRALGEKGYAQFEGLLKDIMTSEAPYKMLKIAKQKGWEDLFHTAGAFILHPTIGKAKLGYEATRRGYRALINSLLDKPQLGITWKRGIDNLKKGNFAQAEKDFDVLKGEVLAAEEKPKARTAEAGPIEITPEKAPEEQKLIGERPKGIEEKSKKVVAEEKPQQETKFRETAKKIVEEKRKAEPVAEETKSKEAKPKNKTKIEALKEGQKKAEENYDKRKSQYLEASKEGKDKKTAKIRSQQLDAAEKRLIDIDEEISRLEEIQSEKKKSKLPTKQVNEKIKDIKRQDISKEGLKAQKKWIIDKIHDVLKDPGKYEGTVVTFDVPGDGEFKIFNTPEALKRFEKLVAENWPDKPLRKPEFDRRKRHIEYPEHALKEYEIRGEKEFEDMKKRAKPLLLIARERRLKLKKLRKEIINHEKYKKDWEKELSKIQTKLKKEFRPLERGKLEEKKHLFEAEHYRESQRIEDLLDEMERIDKEYVKEHGLVPFTREDLKKFNSK